MGLKCSVLGHAFGETTVERDREEQGSEVVITIREVETCERCGHDRIVSENKEVTAIETPDDVSDRSGADRTEAADPDPAPEGGATTEASSPADGPDADASIAEDESEDDDPADATTGTSTETLAAPADGEPDQGAEILDAEGDEPVDDELADPSLEDRDETGIEHGTDPETDDAVLIDEPEDDPGEDDRAPGEWPEEPDRAADDWTPDPIGVDEVTDDRGSDRESTGSTAVSVPEGQFRCPECGFTTAVESSSLRSGDFCPECRRGTLVTGDGNGTRKE